MPLTNTKIPNDLRLLISRKFENEVWILSDLFEHVKLEIKTKKQSKKKKKKKIVLTDLQHPLLYRPQKIHEKKQIKHGSFVILQVTFHGVVLKLVIHNIK